MANEIVRLNLELQAGRDLTINGMPVEHDGTIFEEKIFQKRPSLDHQWKAICSVKKLLARMVHAYETSRVERGDISESMLKALKKKNANAARDREALRHKPGWVD